jgi:hypothetical protein
MFKLVKFFIMMAMVIWVAAAVSALVSGTMGMMKKKHWMKMKEQFQQKMPMMRHKMCENMEEAEAKMESKMSETEDRLTHP